MKAFENWWNTYDCELDVALCGNINCMSCKEIHKITWKAALEWVLSKQDVICIEDIDIDDLSNNIFLIDPSIIRMELNDN
jgi:hypothetical protein